MNQRLIVRFTVLKANITPIGAGVTGQQVEKVDAVLFQQSENARRRDDLAKRETD
jgi:hypothetical protein